MATETGETVSLTPQFNYSRHVEIIKRFVEQLSAHGSKLADDQVRYIEANLEYVREAMAQVLSDDIERQIQIESSFPHGPTLNLHPFSRWGRAAEGDICGAPGQGGSGGRCQRPASHALHTL